MRGLALLSMAMLTACSGKAGEPVTEPGGTPTTPTEGTPAQAPPSPPPVGTAGAKVDCTGKTGQAGDRVVKLASGHTIDLHVPASYDGTRPMPLVLAFHGYLMSSGEMRSTTHLDTSADKDGFLVGFPEGTDKSWNGGDCCGTAKDDKEDDVAVARAMVSALSADYCVDAKRVFATGFSNGGFLAHRLACSAADMFAAVASVSGAMGIDPADCTPGRPVPVLEIHGTNDIVVPYKGGRSVLVGLEYRSVDTTMKSWVAKGACGAAKSTYDKGNVKCQSWAPCAQNADVALCTIDGGAHAWPGGSGSNGSANEWKATDAVTTFFAAHALP